MIDDRRSERPDDRGVVKRASVEEDVVSAGPVRVLKCLRRWPMNMTTNTRSVGDVTIVDISGRIVLGEESAFLRKLVSDLLSQGHKKILFNLSEVNFIDSSGLGHLVSAFTSVRKQKGDLKLLKLTNKVHDVMQITKLYTVFDIVDDEEAAIRSFGQSAAAAS